jgi:transposase-like protein
MDRQPLERRSATRLTEPVCPSCGRSHPAVTVRTDFVVYYRCDACGEIWVLEKPGALGTLASRL